MARLVSDEALRRRLADEGIRNSQRYTWENAADQMWNCIMKAMNNKP
jgi:glycosyltransferase involved in cell wall biosynthesis